MASIAKNKSYSRYLEMPEVGPFHCRGSFFKRGIHHAPDYQRLNAMYNEDKEFYASSCFKMQKHPKLMQRYFEAASVMQRKGKFPFLHAQSSALRAPRIFIETLSGENQKSPHFKYFRTPSSEYRMDRAAVMRKIQGASVEPSSHVLSMSYSLFESAPEESANYFLFSNTSAAQNGIFNISREAITASLKSRGMLARTPDVLKVMDHFFDDYSKLKLGTLFLIGVPKERLGRYVYDSEPYSKPTGIDVQQVIDRYAFCEESSQEGKKALQARLMFFNETMTPSSGIEVIDVTDVKECAEYIRGHAVSSADKQPPFSFFFPQNMSVEEVKSRKREEIDGEVKKFAKSIAGML